MKNEENQENLKKKTSKNLLKKCEKYQNSPFAAPKSQNSQNFVATGQTKILRTPLTKRAARAGGGGGEDGLAWSEKKI